MNVTGFPDLITANFLTRSTTATKSALATAAEEMTTGKKADLARSLGGRSAEYNLVAKALSDIEGDQTRLRLAENRISVASNAVGKIRSVIEGFSVTAQRDLTLSGPVGVEQTRQGAEAFLESSLLLLNSQFAGRSLFGGDDVSTDAVVDRDALLTAVNDAITTAGAVTDADRDAAITAFFTAGGGFDTLVYQGGPGEAAPVRLPNGGEVRYDTKADDPAFRGLLEGLTRVALAADDPTQEWADKASGLLKRAEIDLIDVEAKIGRGLNQIDTALDLGEQEKIVLTQSAETLSGVDAFEAASRFQLLETQLQASYTVSVRLSSLKLVNFLR